jgi:hypothetical protein
VAGFMLRCFDIQREEGGVKDGVDACILLRLWDAKSIRDGP